MKVEFTVEQRKMLIANCVETLAVKYLKDNMIKIAKDTFPEIDDIPPIQENPHLHEIEEFRDGLIKIQFLKPIPQSKKVVGVMKKHSGYCTVSKWYGDCGILINSHEMGKYAIILEVKHGKVAVSNGQNKFFRKILAYPESCMKKLQKAKVFIVHCTDFDVKNRTFDMEMKDYEEMI